MEQQGGISLPDAKHSAYAHILTRCVGRDELVQVDTLSFDILPGDRLLLCSDGLSSAFNTDQDIAKYLEKNGGDAAEALVAKAKELDGSDNISAIAIEFGPAAQEASYAEEVQLQFDTLKEIYLFSSLSLPEAAQVLEIVTVHDFEANDVIMREGEKGDLFYMILNGELEVSRANKTLAILREGDHIGEVSFLANGSRSATVKALSKSRLMAIKSDDFRDLINEDRKLGNKLLWSLAQEIGQKLSKSSDQVSV